ncbi:hypothetical protein ACFL1R_04375 [Candidatus Latescibacterota bacterium]
MKSRRFTFFVSALIIIVICITGTTQAQTFVEITSPMLPPNWALLERALLDENVRFMKVAADKYVNPITGHLECVAHWGGSDGADDAMENFNNWPLLYALGTPKSTLNLFNFIWNGHIDQYTRAKHPMTGESMYYREFVTSFDFEHTGEGIAAFLLLPLSDPEDWRMQERIVRFANFYTGRDTTTHNYDPKYKIIRSVLNGSKGPMLEAPNEYWFFSHSEWLRNSLNKDSRFYERANSKDHTNVKGDITLNLIATSLAVNAYLMTGDEHYKDWVLEYVGAWRERTIGNNGNIPSNVGINGIIGEHWDGKWYGGLYGWNYGMITGFNIVSRGTRIGFGNAYFLSGNRGFLEVLRKQGDILLENGKKTDNGLLFPNRYGDDGWYEYSRNPGGKFPDLFADLYIWTLEDQDLKRLYNATQGAGNPWIEFLKGKNPDYPVNALNREFEGIRRRITGIRNDTSTPDTRYSDSFQRYSGAATSALVNLTMGGLQPMTYGGLLFCQLRYFDQKRQRPGLPEDVAALITEMSNDKTKVTLVNINQAEPREVIVQTGGYREHQCLRVETGGRSFPVNHGFFKVRLARGAGAELIIYHRRFVNQPTVAFPWHGNEIPLQ